MPNIKNRWRASGRSPYLSYLAYASYLTYLFCVLSAQEPNAPARILGRVVAAETGQPLRGAVVEIVGAGGPSTTTDVDGRFEISQRRVGSYSIRASKAGYVPTGFGALPSVLGDAAGLPDQFNVLAGQRIDRGTIRLQRGSVIAGRVMDEFGDPISDASVIAYRVIFPEPGIRSRQTIDEVPTNDLGEYRLHGLMPGQYYISASRASLPPELRLSLAAEMEHARATGGSVASVRSYSEPIVVDTVYGGETGGMNLTLRQERRVRVSGIVLDSSGRPAEVGTVLLRPADPVIRQFDTSGGQARTKAGEFLFTNVTVGEYRLTATADFAAVRPTTSGSVAVPLLPSESVTMFISVGADMSGLRLQTSTAKSQPSVKGQVFIDGAPVDAVARLRYVMLPAGQSPVMPLLAGNGTVSTYPATWPGPPGQFVLRNVSGVIVLRHAGSPGLSLRNVVSNGIDVTGGFEVTQSDVTVEVHLTAFGGVLKGVVKDAGGAPASESDVVLFSADPSHWQVPLSRRMATVRTNDKGAFEVTGLPAGEYVAVAVPDLDRAMWADPVRLERLRPFATPFSVSDGATATIALAVKR